MSSKRLSGYLSAFGRKYPGIWKTLENQRLAPDVWWGDWCYIPSREACFTLYAYAHPAELAVALKGDKQRLDEFLRSMRKDLGLAFETIKTAMLAGWRYTQDIFRFDNELYNSLINNTEVDFKFPSEVLMRLPAWCVYVETPHGIFWSKYDSAGNITDFPIDGFFIFIDDMMYSDIAVMQFGIDVNGTISCFDFPIEFPADLKPKRGVKERVSAKVRGVGSIKEIIEFLNADNHLKVPQEKSKVMIERTAINLPKILSLLLYICSSEPDIVPTEKGVSLGFPKPKRTKNGMILFPPDRPKVWIMGENIGKQIREARRIREEYEAQTGRKYPKAHIRRAHWHGYWTGKRDETQKFIYRWISETLVNVSV